MFRQSNPSLTKCLFTALSILGLCGSEAVAQSAPAVNLSSPQSFAVFRPTTGSVTMPGHFASAAATDVQGGILVDDVEWVRVQIQRNSDSKFWNGATWVAPAKFTSTILMGDRWCLPDVDLTIETSYLFRLSVKKTNGQFIRPKANGIYRAETITDTDPPAGVLKTPQAYRVFSKTQPRVEIFGDEISPVTMPLEFEANDFGVGVKRLSAQVVQSSTQRFWTGENWQSHPAWVTTVKGIDDDKWRTANAVNLTEPGFYIVRLNLEDFAGNVTTGSKNAKYEIKVIADDVPPTGILNNPLWEYFLTPENERVDGLAGFKITEAGFHEVRGRASDTRTGVSEVRVQVERIDGESGYWNQDRFQMDPAWNVATVRSTVTPDQIRWSIGHVDFGQPGRYAIRLSAVDNAGNRSRSTANRRSFIRVE